MERSRRLSGILLALAVLAGLLAFARLLGEERDGKSIRKNAGRRTSGGGVAVVSTGSSAPSWPIPRSDSLSAVTSTVASLAPSAIARVASAAETARIRGTVVDTAGAPSRRARVRLTRRRERPATTKVLETDDEGRFEASVPEGNYFLVAWAGAQRCREGRDVEAKGGEEVTAESLVVLPAVTLAGSVRDVAGRPIAAARVLVHDFLGTIHAGANYPDEDREALERDHARFVLETREDGSFEQEGLLPGSYTLIVYAPGFVTYRDDEACVFEREGSRVDIALPRANAIRGKVRLPSGEPAAGAEVDCTRTGQRGPIGNGVVVRDQIRRGYEPDLRGGAVALADDTGAFVLDGLGEGTFEVVARSEDGKLSCRRTLVSPGGDPLDLVLRSAPSIEVKVVNTRGEPLPNRKALAVERRTREDEDRETQEDGTTTFSWLHEGTYDLRVEHAGLPVPVQGNASVSVMDVPARIELVVPVGAEISGTVLLDGKPCPEADVELMPRSGASPRGYVRADDGGEFQSDGLPAGSYWLVATDLNHEDMFFAQSVELADGARLCDLRIELVPAGRIEGRVLAPGGVPARIAILTKGSGYARRIVGAKEDGSFRIFPVAPGSYTLEAEPAYLEYGTKRLGKHPLALAPVTVDVKAGETVKRDLILEPR